MLITGDYESELKLSRKFTSERSIDFALWLRKMSKFERLSEKPIRINQVACVSTNNLKTRAYNARSTPRQFRQLSMVPNNKK